MQGIYNTPGQTRTAWDKFAQSHTPTTHDYITDIIRQPGLAEFRYCKPQDDPDGNKEHFLFYPLTEHRMRVLLMTNLNSHGFINWAPNEMRLYLVGNDILWEATNTCWPNYGWPHGTTEDWARFRMRLSERAETMVQLGLSRPPDPSYRHLCKMKPFVASDDRLWWCCELERCSFTAPVSSQVAKQVRRHTSSGFWNSMRENSTLNATVKN